jgi:DNA polymerase III subunit delta
MASGATKASGPWGGAVLKTTIAALAKGWRPGLTVLTGDDVYHLDRAQSSILDQLVPDRTGSFGLSIVGDDPITTSALVGSARSSGMFASRRVVFVRDAACLEGDPEPLAAYAGSPPPDSFIIVRAPKLDRKRKLHKALAEAGLCLTFRTPSSAAEFRELAAEVASIAAARGVRLDDRAAGLLLEVLGSDLNRIVSELEKLSAWVGPDAAGGARIDAATVRLLISGSGPMSGWELADALTERDRSEALAAARRLLDAGDEPIRIVGGLASRARSLLRAKAMSESGAAPSVIVDAARAWYFRDALLTGLKRATLAELLAMPARLLEADRSFKSRSLDKGAVLEALVSALTSPPAEKG